MEAHDRLRELGETLVRHPEAATSSPDLITLALDAMVEDGLLVKISTNRGQGTAYGIPVPEHECDFYKPSVVKAEEGRSPPSLGDLIRIEWACRMAGCRKTKVIRVQT